MLVGNLLAVGPLEVAKVAGLYAMVGLLHWLCRRPFFLISTDPDAAYAQGLRVRLWDFLFYASFGVVVASSVRVAGVLLVFSYLIVPALAGVTLGGSVLARLLVISLVAAAALVPTAAAAGTITVATASSMVPGEGVTIVRVFRSGPRALPRAVYFVTSGPVANVSTKSSCWSRFNSRGLVIEAKTRMAAGSAGYNQGPTYAPPWGGRPRQGEPRQDHQDRHCSSCSSAFGRSRLRYRTSSSLLALRGLLQDRDGKLARPSRLNRCRPPHPAGILHAMGRR